MKVYQYDDQAGDPRQPHHSGIDLDFQDVASLGVEYYQAPVGEKASAEFVEQLAQNKAFEHRDTITYSPDAMGAAYEANVEANWHEHVHEHDEIRYILAGSGYFDIRSADSTWARMKVHPGDLIVLPRGSYHRFMVDECNDITMTRLFKDEGSMGNTNRSVETDSLESRREYLQALKDGFA